LVVGEGTILVLSGILFGLLLSLAATRLIEAFLYGTEPMDAATCGVTAILFTLAGLTACWWPARRASRTDPVVTLRCE
jgi:putative ABC transport system permease protein